MRETSEDDTLVYDALLQQFLTLVNRKNALMKRQDQLNMLDKEADLEKKLAMLQEELRALSELEDERKTEEDRKREDLLLEELVECVKKRNELVNIDIKIIQYCWGLVTLEINFTVEISKYRNYDIVNVEIARSADSVCAGGSARRAGEAECSRPGLRSGGETACPPFLAFLPKEDDGFLKTATVFLFKLSANALSDMN